MRWTEPATNRKEWQLFLEFSPNIIFFSLRVLWTSAFIKKNYCFSSGLLCRAAFSAFTALIIYNESKIIRRIIPVLPAWKERIKTIHFVGQIFVRGAAASLGLIAHTSNSPRDKRFHVINLRESYEGYLHLPVPVKADDVASDERGGLYLAGKESQPETPRWCGQLVKLAISELSWKTSAGMKCTVGVTLNAKAGG